MKQPQSMSAKQLNKAAQKDSEELDKGTDSQEKEDVKKFQFPSAPCTVKFPGDPHRTVVPDGVFRCPVSDEKKLEFLEKMVRARIITPYVEQSNTPRQLTPPPPPQTLVDNK